MVVGSDSRDLSGDSSGDSDILLEPIESNHASVFIGYYDNDDKNGESFQGKGVREILEK